MKIITPELSIERIEPHINYFHIKFPTTSRDRVDIWYEEVKQAIASVPDDKVSCNIYDILDANITMTPYLRAKSTELYGMYEKRKAVIGFVVKNTIATQFIRFFARTFDNNNRKNGLFYTREEAINWATKSIKAFGVLDGISN
jgi:hypothetical protein